MTAIESTGESLPLEQRECAAVRHIRRDLARIGQKLLIFGKRTAAEHCAAAIDELREERDDA